MKNFLIDLNTFLHKFLVLLGLRRKKKHWGLVFDSQTRQPIDPAIVKLIDAASGRVLQTCVTDLTGRYGFLVGPGRYKIFIKKSNYVFPSKKVTGEKSGMFSNLYHGEFFSVNGDEDVVSFNIPMDNAEFDWNQAAKSEMLGISPFIEHFLFNLVAVVFWFVFVLLLISALYRPGVEVYAALSFYGFVFLLSLFLPKPRLWGSVTFSSGQAHGFPGSVELCHPDIPSIVIAKSVILPGGKFFLLAQPGKYTLRVLGQPTGGKPSLLKDIRISVGEEGIFNKNISI